MTIPYAESKAGQGREREIRETLKSVGATAVGFMVDDDKRQIVCQFRLGGREITVPMSMSAYEAAWLKTMPCGPRTDIKVHKARARAQSEIAVWAILADWIKAQAAMMAGGLVDTDTAFLPHIHMPDGRRVADALADTKPLLPPPGTSR